MSISGSAPSGGLPAPWNCDSRGLPRGAIHIYVTRTQRTILSGLVGILLLPVLPAQAADRPPPWVRPALRYLVDHGYIERDSFVANEPMARARFGRIVTKAFGGGFSKKTGKVTAAEVSAVLVRALGHGPVAHLLETLQSPDGWKPATAPHFGTEIVARELGLRYNRLEDEDRFETSADEPMKQADIAFAVWKAKTSPSTWSAEALRSFGLTNYSETRREVVEFALSLVGTPYVWGGEWQTKTPAGYPYGAQAHGGFDCSGFAWYVLRAKTSTWSPTNRPYKGWSFPERSSADMAKAAPERLSYKKLRPGDVVFFAPGGRDAKARDVYHAGIYLGRGWMVHSSGSRAGISLGAIGPGSWWHDQITWGRRVIRG